MVIGKEQIEIQEKIEITQKDIDKIIKQYEKMPKKFHLCIGEFSGNKDKIIKEIKKLSKVGKSILRIDYEFNKYMEKKCKNKKCKSWRPCGCFQNLEEICKKKK